MTESPPDGASTPRSKLNTGGGAARVQTGQPTTGRSNSPGERVTGPIGGAA